MPKTPLSQMTAQEFVETTAALGLKYNQLAKALGKHNATISGYSTGQHPIPRAVMEKLQDLIRIEREKIKARLGRLDAADTIASMIVEQNTRKIEQRRLGNHEPHSTEGRLLRRQRKPDTRVYPAYRMSRERMAVYVEALRLWRDRVRELALTYTSEPHQRDYHLEMHDIRMLADTAPRNAPYDVYIERSQWDVVSRALRHLASTNHKAHALRAHWSRHKGSGYLSQRKVPAPTDTSLKS